jgi:nucleotide-binding universal stress UspA family protein
MTLAPPRQRGAAATIAAGFRSILIPVNTAQPELPCDMLDVAARLAAERRSAIVLLAFTEIPLWEELDVEMPELDERVQEMAKQARAVVMRYGVGVHVTAPRTRQPAELILAEAARRKAELIVLGATGRTRAGFDALLRDATTRRLSEEPGIRTMFIQSPARA